MRRDSCFYRPRLQWPQPWFPHTAQPIDDEERDRLVAERNESTPGWVEASRASASFCVGCGRELDPGETVWRLGLHHWQIKNRPEIDRYGPARYVVGGCCRPGYKGYDDFYFRRQDAQLAAAEDAFCQCEGCGRGLVIVSGWSRRRRILACCDECEAAAAERRPTTPTPTPPPRTCDECGETYPGGRAHGRYCSNACRQKAYRARRKAVSS